MSSRKLIHLLHLCSDKNKVPINSLFVPINFNIVGSIKNQLFSIPLISIFLISMVKFLEETLLILFIIYNL